MSPQSMTAVDRGAGGDDAHATATIADAMMAVRFRAVRIEKAYQKLHLRVQKPQFL